MDSKWSESVMFKFLKLYQKQECLWNPRLGEYKQNTARINAMAEIANEMEYFTVSDVSRKIKSVRTVYKREHRLIWESKKNGIIYVPKLFWYKAADEFLSAVVNSGYTSSELILPQDDRLPHKTVENETSEDDDTEDIFKDVDNTNTEDPLSSKESNATKNVPSIPHSRKRKMTTSDNVSNILPQHDRLPHKTAEDEISEDDDTQDIFKHVDITKTEDPLSSKESKATINVLPIPQRQKRTMITSDNVSNANAAIDRFDHFMQRKMHKTDDEFDLFAKYIAIQLREMPLHDAIICQEEIQTKIRQRRLEILSRQSQTRTTSINGVTTYSTYDTVEGEYS